MKTPEEIYDILDKALAEKKASGWCLVYGKFGEEDDKTCCAVTAHKHYGLSPVTCFSEEFGIPTKEVWALVFAFDGLETDETRECPEFAAIGQRLRAKYLS